MFTAFAATLPIFAIALAGWLLTRYHIAPNEFWTMAQRLNYALFLPSLFFFALATADLGIIPFLGIIVAAAATLGAGAALFEVWRTSSNIAAADAPTLGECTVRASVPFGFAVTLAFIGPGGFAAFAVAAAIYLPTAILIGGVLASRTKEGEAAAAAFPLPAFRLIAKNPIVGGALAGLLWHVTGYDLPDGIAAAFNTLGFAAMAIGILAAGAAFDPAQARAAMNQHRNVALPLLGIKFVALPLVAAVLALLFEANTPAVVAIVLLAALPPVVPRFTVTNTSETAAPIAAAAVSLALPVAAVTLPISLWLLT
jgi:predicted permease